MVSKDLKLSLIKYENDGRAFLEKAFRKYIAPKLANKVKKSRIEKIEYSMGVYFATINGIQYGDGGYDWPDGYKREYNLLQEIWEVCEDRDHLCREIDGLSIINEFLK